MRKPSPTKGSDLNQCDERFQIRQADNGKFYAEAGEFEMTSKRARQLAHWLFEAATWMEEKNDK